MRRFRISIAFLCLLIGLAAVDFAWLWLRPIYIVRSAIPPRFVPRSYLYPADTVCFLPFQLAFATVTGLVFVREARFRSNNQLTC